MTNWGLTVLHTVSFRLLVPLWKNEKYILTNQIQAMYTESHCQEYGKFDWSVCFLSSAMGQETWNCMYTCELWPIDVQLLKAVAQPCHWQVTWFECNTIKCVLWLTSLDPWLGVCVGCRWRCQDWWSQGGPCAGDWGSANQGKTPADVRAYVCMQADAEVNCFLLVHLSTCCLSFAQISHSSPYLSVLRTSTTALHSCMYVCKQSPLSFIFHPGQFLPQLPPQVLAHPSTCTFLSCLLLHVATRDADNYSILSSIPLILSNCNSTPSVVCLYVCCLLCSTSEHLCI